jgi:NAD(P)H-hydrate epimerase
VWLWIRSLVSLTSTAPPLMLVEGDHRDIFASLHFDSILDLGGLIGFSFHPPARPPYHTILNHLASPSSNTKNRDQKRLPVLSIDIPSGWDVDSGRQPLKDTEGNTVETFEPEVLLSLTAPKEGVRGFRGRHWLGGRFIPL